MVLTRKETEQTEKEYFGARPIEKSYFGETSTPSVVEEEPVFEVEAEYNGLELPKVEKSTKTLPKFDILPSSNESKSASIDNQKSYKLSPRGKVLAVVCSLVVVLLFTMVIYNAVVLSVKTREINNLASAINLKQSEIETLQGLLDEFKSEEYIQKFLAENNSALRKATQADKVRIVLNIQQSADVLAPTNWFDKLCEFFSNLF